MEKAIELENLGSLITIKGTSPPQCLGNLMHFEGKGTFEPNLGLVEVSKDDADAHNKALDEALIKGLLENCEIGQGGSFYLSSKKDDRGVVRYKVVTFIGTVVSDNCRVEVTNRRNKYGGFWIKIYFQAGGKAFAGKNNGEYDLFSFKRVK